MKNLVVIGLGLLGGSLAKDLKLVADFYVYGIDQNKTHEKEALELGIIDEIASFDKIAIADVVIVAVPVNAIGQVTLKVLDKIRDNALVFDVGSVKETICKQVENHPKRKNFVAAHPLAGTEFSGPKAAITNMFQHKVNILCEVEKTDWKILDQAISLFKLLQMRIKMMQPSEHDRHIAYVSHLSHVSSFMLGKTVLEIEKNEQHIFDMASTGFASTVRLAKSAASTWTPIFIENKENVIRSLNEYIKNLKEFKQLIENEDSKQLSEIMNQTNYIKTILKGIR